LPLACRFHRLTSTAPRLPEFIGMRLLEPELI